MMIIQVPPHQGGVRIDRFLASHIPEYTRNFLKKLILLGKIERNGLIVTKASTLISEGDVITITTFELPKRSIDLKDLPDFCSQYCIFEHEHFLVVNKPAGLITHQTEHATEMITLADILTIQRPEISKVGPPERHGIVHRLDRDTSGLLIIARTQHGYDTLIDLFKNRKIKKEYIAFVKGHPERTGTIALPITRHPADPRKMITNYVEGREAKTDYEVEKYFDDYSEIRAYPVTGRTHQIRVHMAAIGHPVLGDSLYGTSSKLIKRQALHAHKLAFEFDGKPFEFSAPLPQDMVTLTH
jgi:23S rRNA pseudouridine1911/1915/1917 synthase